MGSPIKKEVLIGDCRLLLGDCLSIMPTLGKVDAVVTDPPYPNEYVEKYKYSPETLPALDIKRGLVFWTAREPFPLKFSTMHVWDKKISVGRDFELIFEIGGNKESICFRHYLINSTVAASMCGDVFNEHPSQKPIKLLIDIVKRVDGTILDPFMGSGTTLVACAKLGRKGIGIELDPDYFDIACERVQKAYDQPDLFIAPPTPPTQKGFDI